MDVHIGILIYFSLYIAIFTFCSIKIMDFSFDKFHWKPWHIFMSSVHCNSKWQSNLPGTLDEFWNNGPARKVLKESVSPRFCLIQAKSRSIKVYGSMRNWVKSGVRKIIAKKLELFESLFNPKSTELGPPRPPWRENAPRT